MSVPSFYRKIRLFFRKWYILLSLIVIMFSLPLYVFWPESWNEKILSSYKIPYRTHLDHSMFFEGKTFTNATDVTKACLECHKNAAEGLQHSAHWTWLSEKIKDPKTQSIISVGKKNLMNNFCIATTSNEKGCTKCHAGYGWEDKNFDFNKFENMDCLVCHENSGSYTKGPGGWPEKSVNLAQVAKTVSYPKRENCGTCHFNGGGGMAVKHGDLDAFLINPPQDVDVHMGKYQFLCIDCHKSNNHQIDGKFNMTEFSSFSKGRVSCTQCHQSTPHKDERLNKHTNSVACQTCHIPEYAKRIPTKMQWDWSKAGDAKRKDDAHTYLKIKGEFKYEQNVTPEYSWFNLKMKRYLNGDKINDDNSPTAINFPIGNLEDQQAKIWPFKVHRALQPYDKKENILLPPTTAGKGGYWTSFDWFQSLKLGAEANGLKFSGQYGFAPTVMYWPINHMVSPKAKSLKCSDCHNSSGDSLRLNWKELGYDGDPIIFGGRTHRLKKVNHEN